MRRSYLELGFKQILESDTSLPKFVEEYRFAKPRQWRFDFACVERMVAIETEGGIFSFGRHNRGLGMIGDMEKYNEAATRGWRVLRFTTKHLRDPQYCLGLIKRCLDA